MPAAPQSWVPPPHSQVSSLAHDALRGLQVPEGTNAPEAATRVTRVNGILTKNNPYVEPMARDGSKFGPPGGEQWRRTPRVQRNVNAS